MARGRAVPARRRARLVLRPAGRAPPGGGGRIGVPRDRPGRAGQLGVHPGHRRAPADGAVALPPAVLRPQGPDPRRERLPGGPLRRGGADARRGGRDLPRAGVRAAQVAGPAPRGDDPRHQPLGQGLPARRAGRARGVRPGPAGRRAGVHRAGRELHGRSADG
uniref:Uncharacterized protein n=1 Tax=Amycolatopsis orientalis subsp. vinearia TaxID=797057 RepID=A0A023GXL7_AMYOR|nr:hypothetical protein [Amycolatopsis orientalis subsp. vinearia]